MTLLTNLLVASLAVTTPQLKDPTRVENFLDLYSQNATQYENESFTSTRGKYSLSIDPVKRGFDVYTFDAQSLTNADGKDAFLRQDLSFSVSWKDGVSPDSLKSFHNKQKIEYLKYLQNQRLISEEWRKQLSEKDDLSEIIGGYPALTHRFFFPVLNKENDTILVGHSLMSLVACGRGYVIKGLAELDGTPESAEAVNSFNEAVNGFRVEENKK